ncbi:MAG: hypothetical protein AB7F99_14455 [Vicinamibacterales bacterium]
MGWLKGIGSIVVVACGSAAAGLFVGAARDSGDITKVTLPPAATARWRSQLIVRQAPAIVVRDLYGNPVTPAVATYHFDAFGGEIEEHHPGTRVMRLGSPEG